VTSVAVIMHGFAVVKRRLCCGADVVTTLSAIARRVPATGANTPR